jgi:hypothetical protein
VKANGGFLREGEVEGRESEKDEEKRRKAVD